jgi:flagellar biosynthesis protein FliR
MSRAAPSFNLFAVGLPVSLVFGLVILTVGLPAVQATFMELLSGTFEALERLVGLVS